MVSTDSCCGCGACYTACPTGCISMEADNMGFMYPHMDEEGCIKCGLCEKVCPVLHKGEEEDSIPFAWGGHAADEDIRSASSSGGLFSVFALDILSDGGVVFGAALSDDCKSVWHIAVDSVKDIGRLRGSKYVQSNIGYTYKEAKKYLDEGKKVLFSGTPCQIDGLRLFLKEDYENLLTVEIICHGTPSPKVYEKYIHYMQNKLGSVIERVFFRDEIGGMLSKIKIETGDGTIYREDKFTDPYYKMFLSNTCLRKSCYQCPSRGLHKRADITIGDFWGAENIYQDLIDGKGLSLLIIHTKKGKAAFEGIKNECMGHEVDFNEAIRGNPSFFECYQPTSYRRTIEKDIDKLDFDYLVNKYSKSRKDKVKLIKLYLLSFILIMHKGLQRILRCVGWK